MCDFIFDFNVNQGGSLALSTTQTFFFYLTIQQINPMCKAVFLENYYLISETPIFSHERKEHHACIIEEIR